MSSPDYGALAPVVTNAGALIAAGAAITFAFRGKNSWEPVEEEITRGPKKVTGLLASLAITLLWYFCSNGQETRALVGALVSCAVTTVFGLLVYGWLQTVYTYKREVMSEAEGELGRVATEKIIGGFRLTEHAQEQIQQRNLTIQEYFKGVAYDVDKVWTRGSRALTRTLFIVGYMLLVGAGTTALGAGSILMGTNLTDGPSVTLLGVEAEAELDGNCSVRFEAKNITERHAVYAELSSSPTFDTPTDAFPIPDPTKGLASFQIDRTRGKLYLRLVVRDSKTKQEVAKSDYPEPI